MPKLQVCPLLPLNLDNTHGVVIYQSTRLCIASQTVESCQTLLFETAVDFAFEAEMPNSVIGGNIVAPKRGSSLDFMEYVCMVFGLKQMVCVSALLAADVFPSVPLWTIRGHRCLPCVLSAHALVWSAHTVKDSPPPLYIFIDISSLCQAIHRLEL